MMKHLKHILLAVLALAFMTWSCVDPLEPMPKGLDANLPDKALVFSPSIFGSTVITKAELNEGVGALGELSIETLDVYVYKINSGSGSNAETQFFKRYHFTTVIPDGQTEESLAALGVLVKSTTELSSGTDILLESDWRQAGYDQTGNQKYRIYSIANSRMTFTARCADLNEAALKAMTITSAETHYGSYDIVRPKDGVGPGNDYYNIHIKEKNFLMDGFLDNWTISTVQSQQFFTEDQDNKTQEEKSFPLTRAAAKFIVNVKFDSDFLTELKDEETVLVPHKDNGTVVSTTGAPRFKFSNFMPITHEVTPDPLPSGNWLDNLWDSRYNYDFPDCNFATLSNDPDDDNYSGKATYSLTTYSYSFAWSNDAAEGAVNAPALVLIVNYKTKDEAEETFYYRVPLVDLTKINSIDRNYLYIVDATISSKGAIIEDIVPTDVKLKYKVIPWPNVADITTEAQSTQLQYFVAETEYRLRGNEKQSRYLQYFTPKSDPRSPQPSGEGESSGVTYNEATPKIKNIKVYYYDQNGISQTLYSYGDDAVYSWTSTDQSVTIRVEPDASNNGGGNVYVESVALSNRSVKYITFDAVVDFSYDDGEPVTRSYTITHFPLDNLQSIASRWSSYWDGHSTQTGAVPTGEKSATLPSSWGNNYLTGIQRNSCTYQQFTSQTTGAKGHNGHEVSLSNQEIATIFNVQNNNNRDYNAWRTGANSVTSAKQYNGKYYWVTRTQTDYYGNYSYQYYVADSFWTGIIMYYRTRQDTRPSTGSWIDWDVSIQRNNRTTNTSQTNRHFYAKMYGSYFGNYNSSCYLYAANYYGYQLQESAHLTNNHMYVIQISKADDNIVLGRPMITNSQSNDNTVSPAFMIASQLGATTSTTYSDNEALGAAQHCEDYMEVAENGYRFVGWRLPTQAEVAYILKYQDELAESDVFDNVLTGHWYYTLNYISGQDNSRRRAETTFETSSTNVFTRCIRDLTPEEVIELNEKGTITADSYNY